MNEMIERVARAMCITDGLGAVADGPGIHRQSWHAYEPMARAAIEAMREPTPTMRRVCCDTTSSFHGDRYVSEYDREAYWDDMIDAALAGEVIRK